MNRTKYISTSAAVALLATATPNLTPGLHAQNPADEDAYDRNKAAARQALISSLLNRYIETSFIDQSSTDLSWDGYNDDAAWAATALARGYQIIADPLYLELAGNVWNMAYDRSWDSNLGGGIWVTSPINQNPVDSKCTLSNLSFIPS